MFIGYCICVLERYCFHRWDPYATIFSFIQRLESLTPSLPNYGGRGYGFGRVVCGGVRKGNWQYNPRLSRPPCCTTGRHNRARQKFMYWRHHNNSAFGSWYAADRNYPRSHSTDDNGSKEPREPPWWHFPWNFFNSFCVSLLFGCRSFFHFRCWCRLRHRLFDISVSFSIISSRLCCLLSKQIIIPDSSVDNDSFSVFQAILFE